MKKVESITVSLETSKKLKELKFREETILVWVEGFGDPSITLRSLIQKNLEATHKTIQETGYIFSAPVSSEICLPDCMVKDGKINEFSYVKNINGYDIKMNEDTIFHCENFNTEQEAKALMWIYMKQNKLIQVDDSIEEI